MILKFQTKGYISAYLLKIFWWTQLYWVYFMGMEIEPINEKNTPNVFKLNAIAY